MNFRDMIEPMNPWERGLRLALICGWAALGYWMGGFTGVWAIMFLGAFVYWICVLISGGYNKLKRDFGNAGRPPEIQIDQKTLNMNVEPGAIKGIRMEEWQHQHRDPTRPS
jgi:hypothetical protein